jgi:hypothetical protein
VRSLCRQHEKEWTQELMVKIHEPEN